MYGPAHRSGAGGRSDARWQDGIEMAETLMRGPRWECQGGISDGQEDGRNRGGFLYSDRRSTAGGEQ